MLMVPYRPGAQTTEISPTTPAVGTTVTANSSTNTKGTTPTELIASTARDSYGIQVMFSNSATSNTNTNILCDIMVGAATAEVVLIPDLFCGYTLADLTAATTRNYYFPIFIPAGTRISARSASAISSKTVEVRIRLDQRPTGFGQWVGSRVTAYGVVSASSKGTDHQSGNGSYATATQLTSSTTNPIRYMQLGIGHASDASGGDVRYYGRVVLGATEGIVVTELPWFTDTGIESTGSNEANLILTRNLFDIPAGVDLRFSGRTTTTTNSNCDFIVYGVD